VPIPQFVGAVIARVPKDSWVAANGDKGVKILFRMCLYAAIFAPTLSLPQERAAYLWRFAFELKLWRGLEIEKCCVDVLYRLPPDQSAPVSDDIDTLRGFSGARPERNTGQLRAVGGRWPVVFIFYKTLQNLAPPRRL
jgi:hypothetical protein